MAFNEQLTYGQDLENYDNAPNGYQWTLDDAKAKARIAERNAKLDANFAAMKERFARQEPVLQEVDPIDNEITLPEVSTDGPRFAAGNVTIFEFVQQESKSA